MRIKTLLKYCIRIGILVKYLILFYLLFTYKKKSLLFCFASPWKEGTKYTYQRVRHQDYHWVKTHTQEASPLHLHKIQEALQDFCVEVSLSEEPRL